MKKFREDMGSCLSFGEDSFSQTMQEETRMGNIFGYIRVSSRDQNEDRQLIALKELAIPEKNIFIDKADFQ